jgi:large subunit ribosomal protein L21
LPLNLLIYVFGLWRKTIYAIIESGGKQYKVSPGQTIDVERLDVTKGNSVDLDKVLLIADDKTVTVGRPTVTGARVVATSQGEIKGEKLIVFKYKPKVRYHKKTGHRQLYTKLSIEEIVAPGSQKATPKKKASRPKKEVIQDGS